MTEAGAPPIVGRSGRWRIITVYAVYVVVCGLGVVRLAGGGFFSPAGVRSRDARIDATRVRLEPHNGDDLFALCDGVRATGGGIETHLRLRRESMPPLVAKATAFESLVYSGSGGARVVGSRIVFADRREAAAHVERLTPRAYGERLTKHGDIRCYSSVNRPQNDAVLVGDVDAMALERRVANGGLVDVVSQWTVVLRSRNEVFFLTEQTRGRQGPILLECVLSAGYGGGG